MPTYAALNHAKQAVTGLSKDGTLEDAMAFFGSHPDREVRELPDRQESWTFELATAHFFPKA